MDDRPIYLMPNLLLDSTIILVLIWNFSLHFATQMLFIMHLHVKVLTNLGLHGYSLESGGGGGGVVAATIVFAITYSINATISFLMDTVRCFEHHNQFEQCRDFLYFSVTIFFNLVNLIAATLALLSVLAQLRTSTSSRNSTSQNPIQQLDLTLGSNTAEQEKEEDAKRDAEKPPSYDTLLSIP